jgi:hypothetical protein
MRKYALVKLHATDLSHCCQGFIPRLLCTLTGRSDKRAPWGFANGERHPFLTVWHVPFNPSQDQLQIDSFLTVVAWLLTISPPTFYSG